MIRFLFLLPLYLFPSVAFSQSSAQLNYFETGVYYRAVYGYGSNCSNSATSTTAESAFNNITLWYTENHPDWNPGIQITPNWNGTNAVCITHGSWSGGVSSVWYRFYPDGNQTSSSLNLLINNQPPPLPTTDEQCLALNETYGDDMTMVLDFDPEGMTWEGIGDSAGCMYQVVPGVTVELGGKYHVTFEATGAAPAVTGTTETLDLTGVEPPSDAELVPSSDYTPTTDPTTDCQYSYVDFGDGPMCYTGGYAPVPADYPDGSVRVDNHDGSFDIVEPDGTTTKYTAEGSVKSPSSAPGTATGETFSEDSGGIVDAISSLKQAMNQNFNKALSNFNDKTDEFKTEMDPDTLVSGSSADATYAQYETEVQQYKDDLTNTLDDFGDGSSSPIAGDIVSKVPDFTGSACVPLVMGTGSHTMTIPCSAFDKFKEIFAWILYVYTALSIIDLFFATPKRA